MKHTLVKLAAMLLVLSWTASAMATVTLRFDPNDILDRYPSTAGSDADGHRKADQPDARRVHATWGNPFYETFHNPAAPHTQPEDYNTYMNWRDSLTGDGEGIAVFNSWFLDNGAARSWGETVVVKPGTTVAATAASGWNYRIVSNPYGLGGDAVQWWTLDSANYLRTGPSRPDIDTFTITADLYFDPNQNGWDPTDPAVTDGDAVRFWVGNLNGDDAEFYRSDTQALFFDDQGWGTRGPAASGPFSADLSTGAGDYGSGFEAALTVEAVPAPGAALLAMIGLGAVTRRRRRFSRV